MYIKEDTITNLTEKQKVDNVLRKMNSKNKKRFWICKRIFDCSFSTLALIIFALPMAIIALIIFLGDGYNPIFAQERITRFGKPFKMYKFRTMVKDADKMLNSLLDDNEMDGPVFKIKEDPRITRFGKFLRATSLDEIPQFFNVLKGDMALIGPRPPLPREVEQYSEYHKIRLVVTPGITCIWQTHPKRNSVSFEEWVDMDIDYVLNRTFWLDIKIIFKTVYVMFCKEGE